MSVAYIGLLALVAATPVLLFFDNLIVGGVIQLCAAIGMMIVAAAIRPGEGRHLLRLIRVPAALGVVPLIWMLVQLLPISIGGLSQSIWQSAASALDTALPVRISIDPGLTLIAACRFSSMLAIAFIAAAASIERRRAEQLLLVLAGAAAVISLILLASRIGGFSLPNEPGAGDARVIIVTTSIIGVILFAARAVMIIERYKARRHHHELLSALVVPTGITIVGLLVCSLTLVVGDINYAIFAAACGVATLAVIYFMQSVDFGPTIGLAIGCVAVVAAAAIIWTNGHPVPGDISLRYMADAKADIVSLESRMMEEAGLGGSGAGTIRAISFLYGMQQPSGGFLPTTFAAKIAIELGRPALWIIFGSACVLIGVCARGAFNRGRGFCYPLAGAGVTMAMIVNSFCNADLTNPAISLLVVVTLGLGFAQSLSRSP